MSYNAASRAAQLALSLHDLRVRGLGCWLNPRSRAIKFITLKKLIGKGQEDGNFHKRGVQFAARTF
jgi:hypothetical protein